MQKMKKRLTLKACAVFFVLCSISIFSSPTRAQVTAEDLLSLPTDRIVELARMGEPEAQYWVGRALESRAIQMPNTSRESIAQWFMRAADQGHEEAIYHFFNNAYYYPEGRRAVALQLLNMIAVRGSGRAYYELWGGAVTPNPNHLLEAARLEYRPAILQLGGALKFSDFGSERWDLERAVTLLQAGIAMPREPETSPDSYFNQVCNAYYDLWRIFSGELTSNVRDRSIEDISNIDPSAAVDVLIRGSDFGCPLMTLNLARLYRDGEGVEQDFRVAERLARQLFAALEESDIIYAAANFLLVEILVAQEAFEEAKEYVTNLSLRDDYGVDRSLLVLFSNGRYFGVGIPICSADGVSPDACQDYLDSL